MTKFTWAVVKIETEEVCSTSISMGMKLSLASEWRFVKGDRKSYSCDTESEYQIEQTQKNQILIDAGRINMQIS